MKDILKLLSISEVGRRLNISDPTARHKIRQAKIQPDAISGRVFLYREDRMPEISEALSIHKTPAVMA